MNRCLGSVRGRMQAVKGSGVRPLSSSCSVHLSVSEITLPVPWGVIKGKVWGPDHGRPVLCLHGWADNCGTFNTLIPLLPKGCRYVALDLPGHGLSSHRPPGVFYHFPKYVMDIQRVVDALQWSTFSIIGHSMGGNIGGMYSALYPEKVDSLVLLDTYGFLPADLKRTVRALRRGFDEMLQFDKNTEEKRKVYTYEKAAQRLMAANPTLSQRSVQILLERGSAPVDGGVIFTRDVRIHLENIMRITVEQSLEMQSRIKAPILVILADDGIEKLYHRDYHTESMAAVLQGYRDGNRQVVRVPGDHHAHLNNPEVVAPLLSDFLQNTALAQLTSKL